MHVRLTFARRQPTVLIAAVVAVVALAAGALGVARAARAARPSDPSLATLRGLVDHYRTVTWTFERAAHVPRVPSAFAERHTRDRTYLRWSIDRWTRRAYLARQQALRSLHRRFAVALPTPPRLRAPLPVTLSYNRRLTLALRGIYPGHPSRSFANVRGPNGGALLRVWQRRSAAAALAVSLHAERRAERPGVVGAGAHVHPPLRGGLEREHRERLLRRPADGPAVPEPVRLCVSGSLRDGRPVARLGAARSRGKGVSLRPGLLALAEHGSRLRSVVTRKGPQERRSARRCSG